MWEWCIEKDLWISVVHLPGVQNVIANTKSRVFDDETEWMLDQEIFRNLYTELKTTIDLYASRNNAQRPRYVSGLPDPGAEAVDALSLEWENFQILCYPPFCIIGRCLQK